MPKTLSEIINERDFLNDQANQIVREGLKSIDRILWITDDMPVSEIKDSNGNDYMPKKFSIEKFKVKDGKVIVDWATFFRGEIDLHDTFEIPEIYFNDRNEYEKALAIAKEAATVKEQEALLAAQEENEREAAKQRDLDRQHLEVLLEKRKRGEI